MSSLNPPSLNLDSLSICDLNTKFNDRGHADWGDSNLISIVNREGIYILKPQLDFKKGPFQIELIRNPALRFQHQESCDIGPKFDAIWQSLDNRQYMEVFLDAALMTNVENLSIDSYPRRFRLAKWSPIVDYFPKQCFLAAITTDYQLLIFSRIHDTWIVQADLSHAFDKIWTQLQPKQTNHKTREDFETIRKNLHSLSFCNFCWKESLTCGPLLLAATIPGDIIVWSLKAPRLDIEDVGLTQYNFEVEIILMTDLEYIGSMQLYDSLLIASTRNGKVVLYDLTVNFREFEKPTNILPQVIKTINLITLPPTATLWHKDNIEVTDFYIQSISQDTFRIVLAKSTNICWCIIHYNNKTVGEPAVLAISDSFSAIDGLDKDVSLHQTPATWLKSAGERQAVMIADDGSFFRLEFIDQYQDSSPEFTAIRTGKLDLTRMVPRGLCTSPNGHLTAMISSISLLYEPSKILSPTKLLVLPTNENFFEDCMKNLLDESWLDYNQVKSPMDVCDRVDYIRSVFSLLSSDDLYSLYNDLRTTILKVGWPKNDSQFMKLKIAALLLIKLLENNSSRLTNGVHQFDFDKNVHNIILLYEIKKNLTMKLDEFENVSDPNIARTLTSRQVNSLRNYSSWLDLEEDRKSIKAELVEIFNLLDSHNDIKQESCPICQMIVPFVSVKYGACCNEHRFDRCARSLLLICKSSCELVCEHCSRHFFRHLVWPSRIKWLCCYCQ